MIDMEKFDKRAVLLSVLYKCPLCLNSFNYGADKAHSNFNLMKDNGCQFIEMCPECAAKVLKFINTLVKSTTKNVRK